MLVVHVLPGLAVPCLAVFYPALPWKLSVLVLPDQAQPSLTNPRFASPIHTWHCRADPGPAVPWRSVVPCPTQRCLALPNLVSPSLASEACCSLPGLAVPRYAIGRHTRARLVTPCQVILCTSFITLPYLPSGTVLCLTSPGLTSPRLESLLCYPCLDRPYRAHASATAPSTGMPCRTPETCPRSLTNPALARATAPRRALPGPTLEALPVPCLTEPDGAHPSPAGRKPAMPCPTREVCRLPAKPDRSRTGLALPHHSVPSRTLPRTLAVPAVPYIAWPSNAAPGPAEPNPGSLWSPAEPRPNTRCPTRSSLSKPCLAIPRKLFDPCIALPHLAEAGRATPGRALP